MIHGTEHDSEVNQSLVQLFHYKFGISAGNMVMNARIASVKLPCRLRHEADSVGFAGSDIDIAYDNLIREGDFTFCFLHQI